MPVLRQAHKANFTTLPNELLQDQRLSCRDRGVLVWMLSKPPDWSFSKKSIEAELANDGESSIQAGVKNLQKAGYLKIDRKRQERGKLSVAVWTVFDCPQLENQSVDISPQLDFPQLDNASIAKERINKRKKAVPALEGGRQPEIYFDPESGAYRRRGTA